MAVHHLVAILFHVGWGLFMIAETARLGSQSPANCEFVDDDVQGGEPAEGPCSGYGAGAAFAMFAALSAFGAALFAKRGPLSWYPFVGSLSLYTIAKVSETGGLSQQYCHDDVDIDEYCSGYTAAAVFYFFAFVASLAVLVLMWKLAESRHFAVTAFFAFLGLFSIGFMSEMGGAASFVCELASEDDDYIDKDPLKTRCNGYGFTTFLLAICMVIGFVYAALAFFKKDTGSSLWMGCSVFLAVYYLAWTSFAGTSADAGCDAAEDADDDASGMECSGDGAATAWYLFATIGAIIAAFFAARNHDGFKQAAFLAGFSLFYLGYVCLYGGQSAAACETYNEKVDDDDNYSALDLKNTCNGFGAAAAFSFFAFVVLLAAAILTQTPHGAPTAEDGAKAEPSAPAEKDVPVATAVPVADEAQQKDGANV